MRPSINTVRNGNFTEPTYSSEGMLFSLFGTADGGSATSRWHVLYFADRPVGILEVPSGGSENCTFLNADYLGTPFVATDDSGLEVWSGGLEPFGGTGAKNHRKALRRTVCGKG